MYNLIDENYFSEDRVCEMLNDVLKKCPLLRRRQNWI